MGGAGVEYRALAVSTGMASQHPTARSMIRRVTKGSCKVATSHGSGVVELDELAGVVREVEALRQQVHSMDGRLGTVELTQAVQGTRLTVVEKTLEKIESNTTWILRLIVGGIVTAVIAFIVKGGLTP